MGKIRVVYAADAAQGVSDHDVADIVRQSQRNNERLGITGLLVWTGGVFLQAIEGPYAAVTELLEIIQTDTRHLGIMPISEKEIAYRLYPSWSMEYVRTLPDVSGIVLADTLAANPDTADRALLDLASANLPVASSQSASPVYLDRS